MPFLTSRGLPIGAKGRLYSSSVHSVMLYGSEIGPVKKDAIRLKRNDPRMVKWMCKVRLEDRIFAEELRTGPFYLNIHMNFFITDCLSST